MNLRSPCRSQNQTPEFITHGKSRKSVISTSPRSIDKNRQTLTSQLEILIKMNAELQAKN